MQLSGEDPEHLYKYIVKYKITYQGAGTEISNVHTLYCEIHLSVTG